MRSSSIRKLVFAAVLAVAASAAWADSERFEKAYSLEGVSRIRLENVNGSVELRTWDRNYVRVSAVKSGTSWAMSNTTIRITQPGSEIRIETVGVRSQHLFSFLFGGHRIAKVEYELRAPAGTPVRLETVNGAVRVEGRRAEVHAETVNGSLDMREIRGPVHGETVNGRITIACEGEAEETHLETVNGSIEASFPAASSIRYRLSSVNGRLEAGDREARRHGFGGHKLEGEFNGGRAMVHAETVNGGIRIVLAGGPSPAPAAASPATKSHGDESD
jgi:putative adhesin